MKYSIITPTYKGHFKYIEKYLKSINKYLLDKRDVSLIFTISKDEEKEFNQIIKPYTNSLNIEVLIFEDLLSHFNIQKSPNLLLEKYKKFSFQTLKKFYTMLYSNSDYFLVLDSESMFVKSTTIKKHFENFIKNPFITASDLSEIQIDNFKEGVIENINNLIGKQSNKWFLENFVWFYDKKILNDMFSSLGQPIDIVDKIYKKGNSINIESGVFEIELYQEFIYCNNTKYQYQFLDINNIMKKNLSEKSYQEYYNKYINKYGGGYGLAEMAMMLLTEDNIEPLANMFKDNKFNIIRCDSTNIKNYRLQSKFLNIVQPNILAASQDHAFGVNNKFICLLNNDKYINKFKKHFSNAIKPFKIFGYWLSEFLSIFWYGISSILEISKIASILTKEKK